MDYPNIKQVIFHSIMDIPQWFEENEAAGSKQTRTDCGRRDWDMGLGFSGAIEMAADGGYWPKGAEKMIEATSEAALLKSEGIVESFDFDVTGQYLDMDEYLSGSPECFVSNTQEVPVDVIKIGVQQYTPGGNSTEEYIYRGAALLSVIDDLEANGIRVELWGCTSGIYGRDFVGTKASDEAHGIDMRTCLKRAEDSWSPSSVAFGIAHPAFGRKLGFACAESFDSLNSCGYTMSHSLNFKQDRPLGSDFDVWIGYDDMVHNTYRSVKHALELITAEVKKQLKEKHYAKAD